MTTNNITSALAVSPPLASDQAASTQDSQPGLFASMLESSPAAQAQSAPAQASAPPSSDSGNNPASGGNVQAQARAAAGTQNTVKGASDSDEKDAAPKKGKTEPGVDGAQEERERLAQELNSNLVLQLKIISGASGTPEQSLDGGKGLKLGAGELEAGKDQKDQEDELGKLEIKESASLVEDKFSSSFLANKNEKAALAGNQKFDIENFTASQITKIPQQAEQIIIQSGTHDFTEADRKNFPSLEGDLKLDQEITTNTLSPSTDRLDNSPATSSETAHAKPVAEIVKTVASAIQTPITATTIEIRPEGLGSIQIRLSPQSQTEGGGAWRIDIRTTTPAAHALLTDNLSALRETLKTQNVTVAGIALGQLPGVDASRQTKNEAGQGQEDARSKYSAPGRQQQREDRERKERFTLVEEES